MFCVIPEKRSPILEIPVTFDSSSKPQGLSNDKFYLSLLVFGVWLFVAVLALFVELEVFKKIVFIIGSFIVATLTIRFLLLRESYFKKKRNDLVEKNYQYPHSVFWNIYEVTNGYPAICRYANGLKSIFVVFDKDVIVGREADAEYYHHEAIAEAYLQMHKRGIDCMHIDYMDTVGKDDRVKSLFGMANEAENPDLKEVLLRVFDNVEYIMQHSYASYDVYCFFYAGKDELFMDELEVVLDAFLEANYIRYRVLDKLAIGELVKSVFNINEFSVRDASERLFSDLGGTHYLTPIWVERETSNGVERVTLNKTSAQKEAERATQEAEKIARKNKVSKRKNKEIMEEEVDLFDDGMMGNQQNYDMYNQGYMNNQGYNPYQNPYQNQNMGGYQYQEEIYPEEPYQEEPYQEEYIEPNAEPNNGNMYPNDYQGEPYNPKPNYNFDKGFDDIMGGMSFDDVDDDSINFSLDSSNFRKDTGTSNMNIEDDDEDLEIF